LFRSASHFADFGNGNAFRFLDMFKDKVSLVQSPLALEKATATTRNNHYETHTLFQKNLLCIAQHICFNDDIQGTASVALGGIMASLRITEKLETGAKALADHTFLFMGAGEAGCGIAGLIGETIQLETGCSQEEAYKNIWLVDSSGLVTSRRDMKRLPHHKHPFAHEPPAAAECDVGDVAVVQTDRDCVPASFIDAVRLLKPTTIVGVSGQPQVFTQEVIELVSEPPRASSEAKRLN